MSGLACERVGELKELLLKYFGDEIEKIILFGSQIKGDAGEYSDYDILVILKKGYDWRLENEIMGVCYEIDLKYNIVTDVKVMSQKSLNSIEGKQPFILNALEEGVTL